MITDILLSILKGLPCLNKGLVLLIISRKMMTKILCGNVLNVFSNEKI